jgi:hypothetical protein
MANGYKMFAKLHPAGGLYRYKGHVSDTWKNGKVYFLVKWERPEGISEKSPMLNAIFFVDGQERCVDISFFRYFEQVE